MYRCAILDCEGENLLELAIEVATIINKTRIDINDVVNVVNSRNLFTIGKNHPWWVTDRMINRNTVTSSCVAVVCNNVKSEVAQS